MVQGGVGEAIIDLSETDDGVPDPLSLAFVGIPSEFPFVTKHDCSSCDSHDDGWCYSAAARTFYNIELLEACPQTVTEPEPKKPKHGCNSCRSHHFGWCRAVPGWPFYNIKFLKACPRIVWLPEAKRLALTYEEYQPAGEGTGNAEEPAKAAVGAGLALPEKGIERRGPEKAIGNSLFLVLRARRSCISVASGRIETSQSQDACWRHAQWARHLRQKL